MCALELEQFRLAFFLVESACACYFFFRRRRFDLFSLAFFSTVIYFLPLNFGYARSSGLFDSEPLHPGVYCAGAVVQLGISLIAELSVQFSRFSSMRQKVGSRSNSIENRTAILALFLMCLIGGLGTVLTSGSALFSANKSDLLAELNRFHVLYVFSAMLGTIWSYCSSARLAFFAFVALLAADVLVGFRFGAAIAVMGVCLVWLRGFGRIRLLPFAFSNPRVPLVATAGALFFFVYKQLYVSVKLADWSMLRDRISDLDTYSVALLSSEPFTTQAILNEILINGFSVDGSYLFQNLFQVVPLSTSLGFEPVSFNSIFQGVLFPFVAGGMAGNWWAEWVAVGGWPGFGLGLFIFLSGLFVLNALIDFFQGSAGPVSLLVLLGCFLAFYVHRNEISYFLTLEKRIVVFWLVPMFLVLVMRTISCRQTARPRVWVERS